MSTIDVFNRIIELAEAIDTYWERELPKAHPDYPLVNEGETSPAPPPEQELLEEFVKSLRSDQVLKTLLAARVGRGDVPVDSIASGYEDIKQEFSDPDSAIERVLDTTALGDYVAEGVDCMKNASIDIDGVATDSVAAN